MINLLPPHEKRQINAGRVNTLLWRYSLLSLLLFGLLLVVIAGLYLMLTNNKLAAQAQIDDNQQKLAEHREIQANVNQFRDNLTTAKTILDKEIHYSKVITRIARLLPAGVVLSNLQLDANSFGKPISITAQGKSHEDALKLKTSFENSDVFTGVHLESVSTKAGAGAYSAEIIINATIKPEVAKQ